MNKRIKELAEQANIPQFPILGSPAWVATDHDMEKFAQLIVQDCLDILSPYTVNMNRIGEEYLHPIQEIKKHFGVEL
jgi:hypothetical protein